ncbi:hypothetical protein M406DRAFT_348937 [Cryphonectria parasitica EP155]|uniref:Uncharacterized protein n=1 Tax=Cryphonectria parasitica (strain ATCC 38755 / EP155) TaxID=660469 RepID=A0A9P4YAQ0_CRYP1|nr:uncharacterized protein M406DRAFT_348937 [Cryphonectria parasitica EP155]KAF3769891.1 hypothetical protein M406DRAFT_348937 [Cryphonectria parasitica EP155]
MATSSSQESTASECSATETKEECQINISTPAVVAWRGEHTRLNLHLQYDSCTRTAFFKFRDSLVLKSRPSSKTYLYLFLPPERIQTLALDESPNPDSIPPTTAQSLGTAFSCLRFILRSPADLIGLRDVALTPKNKVEGQVLDRLRALARATALDVFIPHQLASKEHLLSVCNGIRDGLTSRPGQADLACMYEGRGGMKIAVGSSETALAQDGHPLQPSGEAPPSYSETGPSSPLAAAAAATNLSGPAPKKRRLDTSEPDEMRADLVAIIEATCRKMVREEVKQEMHALEKRLTDKMELLAEEYAERQGDRLAEDLAGSTQAIDEKVEDEFYGLRMRLEDFIKEEMAEAEERMVEHLQSTARVHLDFGP